MADTTLKTAAMDADDTPVRRRLISHPVVILASLLLSVALIAVLQYVLPDAVAVILLDSDRATYPFTVQNAMWIVFGVGLGELFVRARAARAERAHLRLGYLPEDETTILQAPELRRIYAQARASYEAGGRDGGFLPRMIQRVILQFRTSRSIEQANALLNSSLELYLHEIDLRYSMVRYVVWAIPTLGFIGTVVGISLALNSIGGTFAEWQPQVDLTELGPKLMAALTHNLGVAFYTTLLALLQTAVLMFAMHVVQGREEAALNAVGQYCLDNLVNRLYEPH